MMERKNQRGMLMITVAVMLAILAAFAYSMTREAGMAAYSVDARNQTAAAQYLAQAALSHQRWALDHAGCPNKNYPNVTGTIAGVGTYSTTVSNKKSPVDIVATGTVMTGSPALPSGAAATIARTGVVAHDVEQQASIVMKSGGDTYIAGGGTATFNYSGSDYLIADAAGGNRILLNFDLGQIPKQSLIVSASLRMNRYALYGSASGTVSVHPITASWDANSTSWNRAKGGTNWGKPGGDFLAYNAATPASSIVNAGDLSSTWTLLPDVIADWVNGVNQGLLLVADTSTSPLVFVSANNGSYANWPTLTVTFQPPC